MRNEAIAATSSGVETVSVLDKEALEDLAAWLCGDGGYCSNLDPQVNDRWVEERIENGNYCNACRDFAGKLLSDFDLRAKV